MERFSFNMNSKEILDKIIVELLMKGYAVKREIHRVVVLQPHLAHEPFNHMNNQ